METFSRVKRNPVPSMSRVSYLTPTYISVTVSGTFSEFGAGNFGDDYCRQENPTTFGDENLINVRLERTQ